MEALMRYDGLYTGQETDLWYTSIFRGILWKIELELTFLPGGIHHTAPVPLQPPSWPLSRPSRSPHTNNASRMVSSFLFVTAKLMISQ